jgi:hypothetical protein
MKNVSLFSARRSLATPGWLLSLALFTGGWAGAQNFVRNPDFNSPLGPDNWTIVYPNNSQESDFFIHGRTTLAHHEKVYGAAWEGNFFGGHFRPYTDAPMEAYFTQIVSGLQPGSNYVVSAWMAQFDSAFITKVYAWLEALGGTNGLVSTVTPYVTGYTLNNDGWARYSVTNTASPSGQIEVRLHFWKWTFTNKQKWISIDAFYDQVSVMPLIQTPLPAPQILSLTVTNQTAAFNWSTIMNNTYDIQVSSNLVSWAPFRTNLCAMGTSLTCTGNLLAAPGVPQFFRVVSYNYVP